MMKYTKREIQLVNGGIKTLNADYTTISMRQWWYSGLTIRVFQATTRELESVIWNTYPSKNMSLELI